MHGVHIPGGAGDERPPGQAAENAQPCFFLSYAHGPSGYPPRPDRELRQGHDWPRRLSVALATCNVFVPLYSRAYLSRWREAYEMAVYLLARRIVEAADASPPAGPEFWGQYEALPSAFGNGERAGAGGKLLQVTVVAPGLPSRASGSCSRR